jgi:peptidoglycan-N-acetylglucosamine deacetylase
MKNIFALLFIGALVVITHEAFSQAVPPPYEIATWSGFRATAINYTFDDGCSNQFTIAIPLFDENGFKLTLFTVTDWVSNWSALQSAAANGHEIAGHTVSHANFGEVTLVQQESELKNSKQLIESNIAEKKCITMAYPFCVPGTDSICSKYYISARGCQGFIEPKTPGSYFNVSSVIGGNLGAIKTLNDFKLKFESAANSHGWCVFLFHGIDNDGGYSPIPSTELRKSLEYLAERKSKYWVTTFASATLYSKERDAIKAEEISATDTSFTLKLSDTLPDSIYNFPISLRRPLPENWPSADVTQDSLPVPLRIVLVNSVVYITFDAVPDAGEVKITRNSTPVIPEVDTIPADEEEVSSLKTLELNAGIRTAYFNGSLLISLDDYTGKNLLIRLFDSMGIELLSNKVSYSGEKKIAVDLAERNLASGVYYVCLSDGKNSWNSKIVIS